MLCPKCNTREARRDPILGPLWCRECITGITSHSLGKRIKDIEYFDGGKKRYISKAMLKQIKSGVVTHEGESLYGKSAQKYMDNYSRKYLGKDLSGSYKNERI